MGYGIVYLLTNPAMPGLVKIGMTTQEDIDKRMRELYTTGVPVPFECQFACRVKKDDCGKIEKALHTAFAPQRINANREFFRIQVEQAKAILELFHHVDITEDVVVEIDNDLTEDDRAASKKAQIHRPPLNFFQMGLQKGDILNWKENPEVTISVYTDRTVMHNGERNGHQCRDSRSERLKVVCRSRCLLDPQRPPALRNLRRDLPCGRIIEVSMSSTLLSSY